MQAQRLASRAFLSGHPAAVCAPHTFRGSAVAAYRHPGGLSPVRPQSAEVSNPTVRGWMQYFGRFYRATLTPLLTRINAYLVRWIRQKHKKLAALRKALQKMWEIADRYPRMFAHWSWTTVASVAW
ncbi:hypothetical protein OH738_18460 [Streptomyces hirsutus]|nr:hypothetical protein OH738_18460 [Streptomyces hirsutus]